jgi:tmRNA-binding protein
MPSRLLAVLALFLGFAASLTAQSAAAAKTYVAAVVVSNRADAKYDDQVSALEDLLSARLADLGFKLVSRELVASNLRSFTPPDAPKDAASAKAAAAAEAAFVDQSSALRLAQSLGADYLLHASITSYAETKRNVTAYGNTLANHDYTLRVAYKLLDANAGGALTGDVVKAVRTEQGNANSSATVGGIFADLLDDATVQIVSSLRTRRDAGRIAAAAPAAKTVTITLNLEAGDLFIPDVRINAENVVSVGESKFKVAPLAATVEVDGAAVGTAPGKITLKPGFSRLRVSRDGYETWERVINAVEGQTLSIALVMTEAGLKRFKESTTFLNDLKNGAKLTDAEVKRIEGEAKSLENSYFRVDTKENFRFILPDRYREVK